MAKGYCFLVLIFCFTFESPAQSRVEKIIGERVEIFSPVLDTIQSTPKKGDLSKSFLRNSGILPASKLEKGIKYDSLVSGKVFPMEEGKSAVITQYFDDDFDSLSGSFVEKLPVDTLIKGQKTDLFLKNIGSFQKASEQKPQSADSLKNILRFVKMPQESGGEPTFNEDSLIPDELWEDKAVRRLQEGKPAGLTHYLDGGFDSIPTSILERFSADSLFGGQMRDLPWQDKDQFQKELESQFSGEIGGEAMALEGVTQKQAMAKRVISVKDREIVDSIRSLASDKLYRISEEIQDSLSMYLISEKKKLKDNLFFEGLVSMEKYKDNVSVSDFSGSLGVRLSEFYELGLGPEIGVSGKDFSAIGARLFARRKIFEDKLFVIVENSFRRNPDFSEVVTEAEGLYSNLKLGAGRLFNLSPGGETKLNIQTLLNPQSLKGGYNNVVDFRIGISKLSRK
ncbi:hypothetical protein [Algoriphagus sp. Y33]|uniref:hypothetical protein n=1 Tax=Algoriphagus sp. Y33 TaxID=2772483 RepID=UPI00178177D9|nr:hypothetical protein [Algoriphagus sp. Y33]